MQPINMLVGSVTLFMSSGQGLRDVCRAAQRPAMPASDHRGSAWWLGMGGRQPCKPPCPSRSAMNLGNRFHSLLSWMGRARIDIHATSSRSRCLVSQQYLSLVAHVALRLGFSDLERVPCLCLVELEGIVHACSAKHVFLGADAKASSLVERLTLSEVGGMSTS